MLQKCSQANWQQQRRMENALRGRGQDSGGLCHTVLSKASGERESPKKQLLCRAAAIKVEVSLIF